MLFSRPIKSPIKDQMICFDRILFAKFTLNIFLSKVNCQGMFDIRPLINFTDISYKKYIYKEINARKKKHFSIKNQKFHCR